MKSGWQIKHVGALGYYHSTSLNEKKCHRSNPHMITHHLALRILCDTVRWFSSRAKGFRSCETESCTSGFYQANDAQDRIC